MSIAVPENQSKLDRMFRTLVGNHWSRYSRFHKCASSHSERIAALTISEAQLNTWAVLPQTQMHVNTRNAIYGALNYLGSPFSNRELDVYLQGSYKNDTNIRSDADVDIVVQCNDTYKSDLSWLNDTDRQRYEADFVPATYDIQLLRMDTLSALTRTFGPDKVHDGTKAIRVYGETGHRYPADVVPAFQYRLYSSYPSYTAQRYVEGIWFNRTDNGALIINFPKPHYENGVTKHQATNSRFKPSVRIFKNFRSRLIEDRRLTEEEAPSYYVQCLIYNVYNASFVPNRQHTMINALNELQVRIPTDDLFCENGVYLLFSGGEFDNWDRDQAAKFIDACICLWNEGG